MKSRRKAIWCLLTALILCVGIVGVRVATYSAEPVEAFAEETEAKNACAAYAPGENTGTITFASQKRIFETGETVTATYTVEADSNIVTYTYGQNPYFFTPRVSGEYSLTATSVGRETYLYMIDITSTEAIGSLQSYTNRFVYGSGSVTVQKTFDEPKKYFIIVSPYSLGSRASFTLDVSFAST